MAPDEIRQRDYYARTADHYDAMHIRPDDEHGLALAAFAGLARLKGARSILDVGAGTGRALAVLADCLPAATCIGVEPVAALREVGHARGVPRDRLIVGDVMALPFPDDHFDFVVETGVLHHVPDPHGAVAEMARVAKMGVMLSDSNRYGQGAPVTRALKDIARRLGLWPALIRLQTLGRMSKWSEGDGLFYSYSVFDELATLTRKFPRVTLMNTAPPAATDLRRGSAQAMILATLD